MLYRTIKKTGDKISTLGFGLMRLPQKFGRINEKKSEYLVRYAVDNGLNYLDTAVPYHRGQSEPFLGKLLESGIREKVKIATKLPFWAVDTHKELFTTLDKQLQKLKTDRVDYYLLHSLNKNAWEKLLRLNVLDFIEKSIKNGKIINIGFSYHGDKDTFKKIIDAYPWIFTQIQFNYLDTECQAGIEGMYYAAKKDISVICMEPLRGGSLAEKPVENIQKIWDESKNRWSPCEWSLRWILNHKEIVTILSGMNSLEQLKENIKICSQKIDLSEEDIQRVNRVVKIHKSLNIIPCTKCNYCMPCPFGVEIPSCFDYFNNASTKKSSTAKYFYLLTLGGVLGKAGNTSLCTACGKCVPKCPQEIDIPKQMKLVKKELEGKTFRLKIFIIKLVLKITKIVKKLK